MNQLMGQEPPAFGSAGRIVSRIKRDTIPERKRVSIYGLNRLGRATVCVNSNVTEVSSESRFKVSSGFGV